MSFQDGRTPFPAMHDDCREHASSPQKQMKVEATLHEGPNDCCVLSNCQCIKQMGTGVASAAHCNAGLLLTRLAATVGLSCPWSQTQSGCALVKMRLNTLQPAAYSTTAIRKWMPASSDLIRTMLASSAWTVLSTQLLQS